MSVIVIKRNDGGISIMSLAGQAAEAVALAPEHLETVVAAEIAQWHIDQRSQVVSWRVMAYDAIPSNRYFRNAWCDITPEAVVDFDMVKCREIHRENLRRLRSPMLADLDVEYQRADENGDVAEKKRIVDKKKALRDITSDPAIEAATTPEELLASIPEMLAKS